MKTKNIINYLLVCVFSLFSFSCAEVLSGKNGKKVKILCDELSDKETLRATGVGISTIYTLADKQSESFARDEIGKSILTAIESTTDIELTGILEQLEEESSARQDSEIIIAQSCKAIIAGAVRTCHKVRKNDDGMYYVYTTYEINRSDAMKQAKALLKKQI